MQIIDSKKISLLTIGTTGDVIPFIALAKKLKEQGHQVKIITSFTFKELITSHDIDFIPINFDIHQILRDPTFKCINTGNFIKFLKTSYEIQKPLLYNLYTELWEASKDCEVLIFHPLITNGPCIAEKLNVPCFIASTVPAFSPNFDFPSAAIPIKSFPITNYLTYLITKSSILLYYPIINSWRKSVLRLNNRSCIKDHLKINDKEIPILYCYSNNIVPRPKIWKEHIEVTGFWFLENNKTWSPPKKLIEFIKAGSEPFYAGFGSMIGNKPLETTKKIISAFKETNERCIIASGWGGIENIKSSDNIFFIDSAPHEWLLPQVKAVIHHGGAGTTAATLRAGKPSIICPFLLDQFFWGEVIYKLNAGVKPLPQKTLTTNKLIQTINTINKTPDIKEKAESIGNKINNEDGLDKAIHFIHKHIN